MNVTIRCICPPKGDAIRHPGGDTITLRDKLPFQAISTIRWAVEVQRLNDPGTTLVETFGLVSVHYVLGGVEAWSVVDDKGKPVEVTPANIREILLTVPDAAQQVADEAEALYQDVMLPLLQGGWKFSPSTPTSESTSPTIDSSAKPPKPSKPSSITTIPTAATEVTASSLDGDSSLSPSSVSAA